MQNGCMSSSRRTFLKTASVGLVSASLPLPTAAVEAEQAVDHPLHAEPSRALADQVNILQGTNSTGIFSRGNTLPIVALPFGMAHWTLQSTDREPWFFHPDDRRILGIRCTHQLSPWLGDYGQATFLPCQGEIELAPGSRSASYRPERSKLSPYEMKLRLERYAVDINLVPTVRGALMQVTFDKLFSPEAALTIDLPDKGSSASFDQATGTVVCTSLSTSGGTPSNFKTFYAVRIDAGSDSSILGLEVKATREGQLAIVRYRAAEGVPVNVRIGTSFISAEQGIHNLEQEVGQQPVEPLRAQALATWEKHLGRAVVQGGTPDQRRTFYSGMYRALLFPRTFHEIAPDGKTIHYSAYNGKVEPGVMYADHGYWDVYRAWYPFMSILFQDRLGEILQAWVNASKEGGWLPQFPAPGYRACMTGSLIDSIFGDAACKGIAGFDLAGAYAGLHRHATEPGDPDKGYGRQGITQYMKLGYVPANVDQSAAETVDSAYGDFCIAQVAKALGKTDDAAMFLKRSENWKHLYDPQVRFLRGKNADGSWLAPFDPIQWGSPYVEGSAWQHRWDVPHAPEQLMQAMGGPEYVTEQLERMCTMPPAFRVGVYQSEIHEMSEMAAVDFGQYAHSNQPVHHVLYLFTLAGRPDRTQYWVRKVLTELYSPDNYAGDEDTGSMAAWFLLSSCGLYQFCPGKAEYVLGSPLFDQVTLTPEQGGVLTITSRNNSPANFYVQRVAVNGVEHKEKTITHKALNAGGTLEFTMSGSPTKGSGL